jgi:EF-hand domain pair
MLALSRAEDASVERSRRRQRGTDADARRREDMRTAFRAFDVNNDGFIDASELRSTMSDLTGDSLTDDDVEAMIRSADKNGDGRIDYEGLHLNYSPHTLSSNQSIDQLIGGRESTVE